MQGSALSRTAPHAASDQTRRKVGPVRVEGGEEPREQGLEGTAGHVAAPSLGRELVDDFEA